MVELNLLFERTIAWQNQISGNVQKFANLGTSEQFVREYIELFDLLGATLIFEKDREEANNAISSVLMDGLMPAFLELQQIRKSVGADMPLVNRFQLYEDFSRKLWKAYKDLMQRVAAAIGFDIGFVFQKESKFEEGLKKFRAENATVVNTFEGYLREVRKKWQEDLSRFRNGFLEHQEGERKDFDKFYNPVFCEQLFTVVWRTIVEILVELLNLKMPNGILIVENDPKQDPRWPKRFRFRIPTNQ